MADRVAAPAARRAVLAAGSLAPDYDAIEAAILNIGGWMDAYVDAALPDAGEPARPRARTIVGNWVHGLPSSATPGPEPRRAPRAGAVLRPLAEGHRERRRRGARGHLVRARVRRAGAVPGRRCRAAGGRRAPTRIRRSSDRDWRLRGRSAAPRGRPSSAGRGGATTAGGRDARCRPIPPPADGRDARLRCRGAPAGRRTGSRATCARTRRSARPTPPRRSTTRSRSSACPRSCSTCRRPAPVATVVVRLTDVAPDGTSAQVSAGILNLTHRTVARPPGAAGAGTGRGRSASRCGRPATGSCPAIASGSPSPRPRGR